MAVRADGTEGRPAGEMREGTRQAWRTVAAQTARDLWAGSVLEWAASLAFYAVLSLFPLLIASMVAASYIVDVGWATNQAIDLLGQFIPEGEAQIEEIIAEAIAERQRVGLISVAAVLLTGRRILGGLVKGLNHVSDVAEQDDTITRKASVELALTAGIIVLIGVALTSRWLLALLWDTLRAVPGPDGLVVDIVTTVLRIVLLLAMFTAVYAYVPRGERLWRAVFVGASLATALYLMAQGAFSLLVDVIWTNLSLVYGPLALAALLLTWCWYVALITLVGASFASHVKVMILQDRSPHEAGEQHTGN